MIDFYESLNFSDKILFVHSSTVMLFASEQAYKGNQTQGQKYDGSHLFKTKALIKGTLNR